MDVVVGHPALVQELMAVARVVVGVPMTVAVGVAVLVVMRMAVDGAIGMGVLVVVGVAVCMLVLVTVGMSVLVWHTGLVQGLVRVVVTEVSVAVLVVMRMAVDSTIGMGMLVLVNVGVGVIVRRRVIVVLDRGFTLATAADVTHVLSPVSDIANGWANAAAPGRSGHSPLGQKGLLTPPVDP
jgi:hypothetical protein